MELCIDKGWKLCYFENTRNVHNLGGGLLDYAGIRQRLVDARGKKSQTEVAKDLGISVSSLSMYESCERIPRDEVKEQRAKYYGVTVGFLFFGE